MTIETIFETDTYRWDFDNQYGTGWFVRKADDHVSLMETGTEAVDTRWHFKKLNARKDILSENASAYDETFNEIAKKVDYSPRWSNSDG